MASSSSQQTAGGGGELILAASRRRPVTAYDALTGSVVAELTASDTPRHGLAVAAGSPAPFVAASHVCPDTGAASVRLLPWWSPASSARSMHVPEPVAPLVATPCGSYLLAGGASGRVHALELPSGNVVRSFRAHTAGAVSCLALNDDGSLLVSGGESGEVAVFPLIRILDVDTAINDNESSDLAVFVVAAHAAAVTSVACGHGGCNAVFASASADGTCKLWSIADGAHLRTITLTCSPLSLALDPTASRLFAGGSDGRVHVASLDGTDAATTTLHASANTSAAVVSVGVANGSKSLVTCTEDGEVRVWDLAGDGAWSVASTFRVGRGAVSDVLVVSRPTGDMVRAGGVGVGGGFVKEATAAWTRAGVTAEMEEALRESEEDREESMELIEMTVAAYKRALRLVLREVDAVASGRPANGNRGDGNVSD